MQNNHAEHANHVDRAKRDTFPGGARPSLPLRPADSGGNRSLSQTGQTEHGGQGGPSRRRWPDGAEEVARWLAHVVRRLRRWRAVPDETLHALVTEHGRCMSPDLLSMPLAVQDSDNGADVADVGPWWDRDPAPLDTTADRMGARMMCAGCPVVDACIELELRESGPDAAGVWGRMPEADLRALYPLWRNDRDTRDHAEGATAGTEGAEGGERR